MENLKGEKQVIVDPILENNKKSEFKKMTLYKLFKRSWHQL